MAQVAVPPAREQTLLEELRRVHTLMLKAEQHRNHQAAAAAVRVARWELGRLITRLQAGRA